MMGNPINIFKNLTFWVLLAIVIGILLGHYAPDTAIKLEFLGKTFIQIVKLFIAPIIFFTITIGISNMGDLKKVGRVGIKSLVYFEVVTTFALLIGIGVAYVFKPGEGVAVGHLPNPSVLSYQQKASQFNWWQFFKDNFTLQVLIFSIAAGTLLNLYPQKSKIIVPLGTASKYVFKALHLVMYLAPLGALGGMAFTIGKYGVQTLLPLMKLMVSVYATMAIFIFVVLYFILLYYRIDLLKILRYIKEELLIVLGTSSSEAALPSLMEKLEKLGCDKPVVGLVVPAGYAFNLDGTTIYLSMATLFLSQVYQVSLSLEQLLTIIGTLMITSKGAAGVTGSGFVVLASTLSAIKVIPLEGLALLLGVDRFMSEARSITNFIGNATAALWISNNEKSFDRNKMLTAFDASVS